MESKNRPPESDVEEKRYYWSDRRGVFEVEPEIYHWRMRNRLRMRKQVRRKKIINLVKYLANYDAEKVYYFLNVRTFNSFGITPMELMRRNKYNKLDSVLNKWKKKHKPGCKYLTDRGL